MDIQFHQFIFNVGQYIEWVSDCCLTPIDEFVFTAIAWREPLCTRLIYVGGFLRVLAPWNDQMLEDMLLNSDM